MKKLFFIVMASCYAVTAFAASEDKSSTKTSDKNTGTVVKDEQADNAKDKQAVKEATPKAKQSAKEEADKTKAHAGKSAAKSDSTTK